MTVVLDTTVLVAALVAEGLCREVVHRAVRMRVLASSTPLIDELQSALQRKFEITPATSSFLKLLRQEVRLVEPRPLAAPVCRDPDDDVVLATAIAAAAELVVTGDSDLPVLGEYDGIVIMSPRQFLQRLDINA